MYAFSWTNSLNKHSPVAAHNTLMDFSDIKNLKEFICHQSLPMTQKQRNLFNSMDGSWYRALPDRGSHNRRDKSSWGKRVGFGTSTLDCSSDIMTSLCVQGVFVHAYTHIYFAWAFGAHDTPNIPVTVTQSSWKLLSAEHSRTCQTNETTVGPGVKDSNQNS